ncbi:hypothetical protein AK830_g695 [Neonectria ditissima]|uniref:Xylanolytic transcriptional activator regulatory domain-containing protein n=1 Tax=Neonectria ditissima TaxID=78410 RepID=A0A0P7C1Q3_9HYPO|nr:hypothetical protein AK830_g695 [Neonectria ditissima]
MAQHSSIRTAGPASPNRPSKPVHQILASSTGSRGLQSDNVESVSERQASSVGSVQAFTSPSDPNVDSPEFCGPSSSEFTLNVVSGNLKAMGIPSAILDKPKANAGVSPSISSQLAQYGPFMKLLAVDPLWDIRREDAITLIKQWYNGSGALYPVVDQQRMLETANSVFTATENAQAEGVGANRGSLVEALFTDETNKLKIVLAIGRTVEMVGGNDNAQRLIQSTREAVEGLLWNSNTIDGIQILVLMALYYYHLDEEVRTGRIVGFAARLCLEMGLHRRATIENTFPNQTERSDALRTFWCVYTLERRTSLGQGVPFSIQDPYVDSSLFNMHDFGPSVSALLGWTKLAGKTWQILNSQGEKEADIDMDELDFLECQITRWYGQLPDGLKLDQARLQQSRASNEISYMQAVLFLRRSHLHNLIYRPTLQSAARIAQDEPHAHVAVRIAKESLQTLSDLNEYTPYVKTWPLFFKHLLLTAFGNLLLAVVNASSLFAESLRHEFDVALDLIKQLSTRSGLLMRLWNRLQGLRDLQAKLLRLPMVENSTGDGSSHTDFSSSSLLFDELFPALPLNMAPSGGGEVPEDLAGGPVIVGDRYAFLPYWLVHACASRKWIFVTPDYRLMPETTAHSAIQDAKDAYNWVRSSLPGLLGRSIGTVHVAGSSAGGYLAMTTAMAAVEMPDSLLLVYGMLDPAGARYTTPGSNIFGRPVIDTEPVLREFPVGIDKADKKVISAYPLLGDPAQDLRFALISALHIEARFPDYMTGVAGISKAIAGEGLKAVLEEHRVLFPCSFGSFAKFPRTMLLHGLNDSAVLVENSFEMAKKLREAGVSVATEFPAEAEHGFDARAGNVDVEGGEGAGVVAVESLRRVIGFLDSSEAT